MVTFEHSVNHVIVTRMVRFILVLHLMFPVLLKASSIESEYHNGICGVVHLREHQGTITSPNYPHGYPEHSNCVWIIESPPNAEITIRVYDLDIEEDPNCDLRPCCNHSWLSIPQTGGGAIQKLCGHELIPMNITVSQVDTHIKFHSSKVLRGGRGFRLQYTVVIPSKPGNRNMCLGYGLVPCDEPATICYNVTQHCNGVKDCASGIDEIDCCGLGYYPCASLQGCYTREQKCDGRADCHDYSDETNCDIAIYCGKGQALCSSSIPKCFNPKLERCDGKTDCPFGEDEVDCHPICHGKIMCANGKGCYSTSQRCNDIRNCHDNSDEMNCTRELCVLLSDKFLCDNGQCIPQWQLCNGVANCLDNSDEQNCLKNSVITAAIMGSLICGLLLVIAVGCMCRLHSVRSAITDNYQTHQHSIPTRVRATIPIPDDEFFNREPPPAYSIAVNDCQQLQCMASQVNSNRLLAVATSDQNQRRNSRRSSRRHTGNRRRSQRNTVERNSLLSDPSVFGIGHSGQRSANYSSHAPQCLSIPVSSTLETSLVAQRESVIVSSHSGDNKPINTNSSSANTASDERISSEDAVIVQVDREGEVSSSNSSSISPTHESVTSSTSLLSYLSGNDDP